MCGHCMYCLGIGNTSAVGAEAVMPQRSPTACKCLQIRVWHNKSTIVCVPVHVCACAYFSSFALCSVLCVCCVCMCMCVCMCVCVYNFLAAQSIFLYLGTCYSLRMQHDEEHWPSSLAGKAKAKLDGCVLSGCAQEGLVASDAGCVTLGDSQVEQCGGPGLDISGSAQVMDNVILRSTACRSSRLHVARKLAQNKSAPHVDHVILRSANHINM